MFPPVFLKMDTWLVQYILCSWINHHCSTEKPILNQESTPSGNRHLISQEAKLPFGGNILDHFFCLFYTCVCPCSFHLLPSSPGDTMWASHQESSINTTRSFCNATNDCLPWVGNHSQATSLLILTQLCLQFQNSPLVSMDMDRDICQGFSIPTRLIPQRQGELPSDQLQIRQYQVLDQ